MCGTAELEGHRIPFGFRHRTLPHFAKGDFSPEAMNSSSNHTCVVTPQEFFFHGWSLKSHRHSRQHSRDWIHPASTMVCYNGTARTSPGDLIQFTYGEDGWMGPSSNLNISRLSESATRSSRTTAGLTSPIRPLASYRCGSSWPR